MLQVTIYDEGRVGSVWEGLHRECMGRLTLIRDNIIDDAFQCSLLYYLSSLVYGSRGVDLIGSLFLFLFIFYFFILSYEALNVTSTN